MESNNSNNEINQPFEESMSMDESYGGGTIEDGIEQSNAVKNKSKQNIKNLFTSPETRPKVIAMGIVLAVAAVYGYTRFNTGAEQLQVSSVATDLGAAKRDEAATENYTKLSRELNAEQAKLAEDTGTSHIDVLTDANVQPLDLPSTEEPPAPKQQDVVYRQNTKQSQPANRQVSPEDSAMLAAMGNQARALMESWAYTHHSTAGAGVGFKDVGEQKDVALAPSNDSASAAPPQSGSNSAASAPAFTVKAGDIYYGVSNIDINTDSASPEVTASILSGPLKGGTLIGSYTKGTESVVIRYTSLSLPWVDEQIPVSVVAVDPSTSSKDIATDVDNHYFERYGLMIASAFVSGIGEAASRSGSVVTTGVNGTTESFGNLGTGKTAQVAIGRVGEAIGRDIERSAPRQPTIKVAPGTDLGLLFLQNVGISKANPDLN